MPGEILHSGSYWQDLRRRRAAHATTAADRHHHTHQHSITLDENHTRLQDANPVYTFVPNRTVPLTSVVLRDGRVLHHPSPTADTGPMFPAPVPSVVPAKKAARYHRSRLATRAEALLRARPSPDDLLLMRLREDPEQRRRKQLLACAQDLTRAKDNATASGSQQKVGRHLCWLANSG